MTEFTLAENLKLGLMPNRGIAKTPHPEEDNGIPRCELYCYVADVEAAYAYAVKSGARLISPVENRDWGDKVCYFAIRTGISLRLLKDYNTGNYMFDDWSQDCAAKEFVHREAVGELPVRTLFLKPHPHSTGHHIK